MKSAVIAKPNLKVFLCGALLAAVIGHFAGNGQSQGRFMVQARTFPGQLGSDTYLHNLLDQAAQNVTPELCMQISAAYEQRHDVKKALAFLRFASQLEEAEASR
jgi:hypothetical protein